MILASILALSLVAVGAAVASLYDPSGPCPGFYSRRVEVSDAAGLTTALKDAEPGDVIRLSDGDYRGRFTIERDGRSDAPITLCGRRTAILEGTSIVAGEYGLHVMADYWSLIGFTVRHHSKGIVTDGANHLVLRSLEVYDIGGEGIRFRTFSSDNLLTESWIHDTGTEEPENGEGVYIGTAASQWCRNSDCEPDESDGNRIVGNVIGPDTRAESIDIKEGTTGGVVAENSFDGEGMTETDSWLDVKGNGWTISANHGRNSPEDGFQTHVTEPGWGEANVFQGNVADVEADGYGFRIDVNGQGNIVTCDNEVTAAKSGYSNVPCAAVEASSSAADGGLPGFASRLVAVEARRYRPSAT